MNLNRTAKTPMILLSISMLSMLGSRNAAGRDQWSWQQQHATVKPTGDIEWAPQPFRFIPGNAIRYIDFTGGSDRNPGTRGQPWQHHPWDPAATGKSAACKTADTFVFKRGVVYRGEILVRSSGSPGQPLRLTSDPAWGSGEAVLAGSEPVREWKRGATLPLIPEADKVWYADLDFTPRNVWMLGNRNRIVRIPLARTPNWQVTDFDDVKKGWYAWDNPGKLFNNFGKGKGGRKVLVGIDTRHVTGDPDYFKNAIIWPEYGWVMGTPYPTLVEYVDTKKHELGFGGQWGGPSSVIFRDMHYYLEDKPQYLDSPGEFWFQKKGDGGRLFLRLPGDINPTQTRIEAARRIHIIESTGMNHLEISGLTFRFTNVYWDLTAPPFRHRDVDPACIRLIGSGTNITVKNCKFEHVHMAIRLRAEKVNDIIDGIRICDNSIRFADQGVFLLQDGGGWGKSDTRTGRLYDVKIMRNRAHMIGMRPNRFGQGHAIEVDCAQTLEVAGNILDKCYGSGIFVYGAKRSSLLADRPLSRILIHHNKVTDAILNTNDWGEIETWQGGPAYVYCNIAGNPGGFRHWSIRNNPKQPGAARFGHAYYLDGAFKNYHFNNIAWGRSRDPLSPLGNTAAFQEIHSFQNTFFNNTIYNFVIGSRRQAPHAGRDKFLANIWEGIGHRVFRHARPAKTALDANAADAGRQSEHFAYETNAFARNIFRNTAAFGVFEATGQWHKTFESFRNALRAHECLLPQLGSVCEKPVMTAPEKHDFRLRPGSPAIDNGAKVFVPWALYAMVGEWNFYHAGNDPARILDEHWYMAPYYAERTEYADMPMFPLRGINITAGNYVQGPLENWINGALKLNGKNQYAVLANAGLQWQEEHKTGNFKKEKFDWVEIDCPEVINPGKACKITLRLRGIPDNKKIHVDMHWLKHGGRWGGINCHARPQVVKGEGPYVFTVIPKSKPKLEAFQILAFVTDDGRWKTRSKLAKQSVAAGRPVLPHQLAYLRSPAVDRKNLLIEVYFRTEPGAGGGVLLQKLDKNGYSLSLNQNGTATFVLQAGPESARLAGRSRLNDGKWHHLIAEADRKRKRLTIYVDGNMDAEAPGLDAKVSLANTADVYVGGTPSGNCLAGTLDFLRISLGTLAEAKTSISELYAWQFSGPFLRDFTGKPATGKCRDAGALELPAVSHRQY